MERLWAPWRLAYVTRTARGEHDSCIFCENNGLNTDLVVFTGRTCFIVLNLYPYNNGHLMTVPKRHLADLASTTADERAELMGLTRLAELALAEAYHPHGINVGINLGRPAGAGVLDHLHIHMVPRWNGDTNFMGVVGNTRVLPEDLSQAVARLRPIFDRLAKEHSIT
jgi:ATP adenylyltransferase